MLWDPVSGQVNSGMISTRVTPVGIDMLWYDIRPDPSVE